MNVQTICAMHGISQRLFYQAKHVSTVACPDLMQQIEQGNISINLALQICRANHDGQQLILKELVGIKGRKRTAFVREVIRIAVLEAKGVQQ